ncbi:MULTISPECIES: hypothetical protein [Gordonia]|uniref:Uncharacterized protein n=1 Tax=Gordonia amicalis TaxID=89053 RepID=A0AAE4R667_9ACTN|nr:MULTISPECIES: hypothetical protein [Gordonia]MCZ4581640.1 hypothetical protein [Gordonia amicalis]MCZ4651675.1 hypothetical protein [Gordonia amicalis]MDJ0455173.1 hypothetical protein [Gordonia amicalis]MDV6306873.1 hypothetical protein [Gordonia amicalis]MDV6311065.1 hypothetical protein [Gordonia amicalis]
MSTVDLAISLPAEDRTDLDDLGKSLQRPEAPFETRSLDGETVMTIIVTLSTVTFPYFEAWLNARVAARKDTSVSINGVKIDGYSANDAVRIYSEINKNIPIDGSNA